MRASSRADTLGLFPPRGSQDAAIAVAGETARSRRQQSAPGIYPPSGRATPGGCLDRRFRAPIAF
ncbi:hypothetical protein T484DRAFT_1989441 [Baffinella frigidus]|nr:hypothetical protein T484DRAFT_1989441 [Cryptophyta sp. CCMP2293]